MAKLDIKFNLKRPKTDKDTEILFRVNCGKGITFSYPLKSKALNKVLRIPTALWDSEKQAPIPINKVPPKYVKYKAVMGELKSIISLIESEHQVFLNIAKINKINIDKMYFKESYDKLFGFSKIQKSILISDYLISFVKDIKDGVILTEKKTKYADGSIKPYNTLINNIKMFDYLNSIETTFANIDSDWYDCFVNFLFDDAECTELDLCKDEYTPKSVGKYIKCIKHIMKYEFDKGRSSNIEFQKKYFKAPDHESYAVVLNVAEIEKLAKLTLNGVDEECRDIFLVGCYSGLRQNDFSAIKPSYFSEKDDGNGKLITLLTITTKKTKSIVSIPVVDDFLNLVKKYNYQLPSISSKVLNERIKVIAEKAGITNDVTFTSYKGGVAKTIVKPKCKLIASHTCRRSAITNMYFHYEIEAERIMRISGHKDYDTFSKYIRFGDTSNAIEVAKQLTKKNNENKPAS